MKDALRNHLRNKRSQLPPSLQQQKSDSIVEILRHSEVFLNANKIGFYHAVRGEADPVALKTKMTDNTNKQFYLPVLARNLDDGLVFVEMTHNTKFENNKFSIPEPVCTEENTISADMLDLVAVPLLGFDTQGNRLGMGGGFYDRCFAFKKLKQTKPLLVGFAYDFQEVESLTAEAWDVSLDMIATETALIQVT